MSQRDREPTPFDTPDYWKAVAIVALILGYVVGRWVEALVR